MVTIEVNRSGTFPSSLWRYPRWWATALGVAILLIALFVQCGFNRLSLVTKRVELARRLIAKGGRVHCLDFFCLETCGKVLLSIPIGQWSFGINEVWALDAVRPSPEDFRNIAMFPSIEYLRITNGTLYGKDMKCLTVLTKLKDITLENCQLDHEFFAELGSLHSIREVRLRGSTVSDVDLMHLGSLSEMRVLDLSETSVTGSGLQFLQRLPSLHRLQLDQCSLRSMSAVAHLEHLENLSLRDSRLDRDSLHSILAMPDLLCLDISGTNVSDEWCDEFRNHATLEHFAADRTNISDEGLRHLLSCSTLKSITLASTQVSIDGFSRLSQMPCIERVYIFGMWFETPYLRMLDSYGCPHRKGQ